MHEHGTAQSSNGEPLLLSPDESIPYPDSLANVCGGLFKNVTFLGHTLELSPETPLWLVGLCIWQE